MPPAFLIRQNALKLSHFATFPERGRYKYVEDFAVCSTVQKTAGAYPNKRASSRYIKRRNLRILYFMPK